MKLAKNLKNPFLGVLDCFRSYWRPLDKATLDKFTVRLYECGYIVECSSDLYNIMKILKQMNLIDIQYTNGKPDKIINLFVG